MYVSTYQLEEQSYTQTEVQSYYGIKEEKYNRNYNIIAFKEDVLLAATMNEK